MTVTKKRIEFKLEQDKTVVTIDYLKDNGSIGSKSKEFPSTEELPLHYILTRGHLTGDGFLKWQAPEKVGPSLVTSPIEETKPKQAKKKGIKNEQ